MAVPFMPCPARSRAANAQAMLLARRAVAVVRREATRRNSRTFAPGDDIPYDVTRVFDLDGDVWEEAAIGGPLKI